MFTRMMMLSRGSSRPLRRSLSTQKEPNDSIVRFFDNPIYQERAKFCAYVATSFSFFTFGVGSTYYIARELTRTHFELEKEREIRTSELTREREIRKSEQEKEREIRTLELAREREIRTSELAREREVKNAVLDSLRMQIESEKNLRIAFEKTCVATAQKENAETQLKVLTLQTKLRASD